MLIQIIDRDGAAPVLLGNIHVQAGPCVHVTATRVDGRGEVVEIVPPNEEEADDAIERARAWLAA
jgi:hypothetical protein